MSDLGRPEAEQVRRLDGGALDDHCPSLVYESMDFVNADIESFTSEVKFVDFAESYLTTDSEVPDLSAFTVSYSAPEVLFWEDKPTQSSDIWALACIWFELRSGTQLFREGLGGQRIGGERHDQGCWASTPRVARPQDCSIRSHRLLCQLRRSRYLLTSDLGFLECFTARSVMA